MNTPQKKIEIILRLKILALIFVFGNAARAGEDCQGKAGEKFDALIRQYGDAASNAEDGSGEKRVAQRLYEDYLNQKISFVRACEARNEEDRQSQNRTARDRAACEKKAKDYPLAYSWDADKKRCVNKSETASSRTLPDSNDCNAASQFSGQLKGQNCKKALNTIRDVRARNSALGDATTAATTAYSSMQAMGATGAQNDAQTRQANIMKTLAFSKIATGALNLTGAMQLKSAASGAEDANSTITSAQKALANKCSNSSDEQACFYQNAQSFGISPDSRNFASFSRMKQAAQQSMDQAEAANSMAKTSMITGAADLLVGLQAMKAAQLANSNAQQMAPPPLFVPPPPAQQVRLGNGAGISAPPSLEPGTAQAPTDYGNPGNDTGTFGPQKYGRINGTMVGGKGGVPNVSRPAASGVSGGGGVSTSGGGGGGRGGGGSRGGGGGGKRGTAIGEYSLAGGGGFKGGGSGSEKGDAANPLADMLSKLFPQDQSGKPVVDARQIAAASGEAPVEEFASEESGITAADLSIFEQISAKYRQLNNSGRF